MQPGDRVPFTILTGFLGSGKTTTLNRVLAVPHDRKIAVLVNELGRVSIDSELILSKGDDLLELAGGCLCCKVDIKNDLWDGILDIIARSSPDQVVLETTGIAEPQAILEGLERLAESDSPVARSVQLAGVICAVDVAAGVAQLDGREEARLQVDSADRILMTKLDLAGAEAVAVVHARVGELNPEAERASFPSTPDGDRLLVHWLLEARATRAARGWQHHHRDGQIVAVCFEEDGWFARPALEKFLEGERDSLLRIKGFVAVQGESNRALVELAGGRISLRFVDPWPEGEEPRSQLVFIGEGIDEAGLRRRLWACRVGR